MDTLSSHKGEHTFKLIHAANAELVYLPPYSPDLNPIEQAFSKIKQCLRSLACRSVEHLWSMMQSVLDNISPIDAVHFFGHCGYTTDQK